MKSLNLLNSVVQNYLRKLSYLKLVNRFSSDISS